MFVIDGEYQRTPCGAQNPGFRGPAEYLHPTGSSPIRSRMSETLKGTAIIGPDRCRSYPVAAHGNRGRPAVSRFCLNPRAPETVSC